MSTNTTNKSKNGKNCGTFALHVYISINLSLSELSDLVGANKKFEKSKSVCFDIFSFRVSDALHLPCPSQRFLVIYQQSAERDNPLILMHKRELKLLLFFIS